MMSGSVSRVRGELASAVAVALARHGLEGVDVVLERPSRHEHGDWSTNVALVNAKRVGRAPRELATALAEDLALNSPDYVRRTELAGPGFVNFFLDPMWLHEFVVQVVAAGVHGFGRAESGHRRVNVEFVSANPTGPVHAGHARGAAYGDSLARILERRGCVVTREFYINDRGTQMATFAQSLAARSRGEEPPADGYLGGYIADWAARMPDGADPLEYGYSTALADQRQALGRFGVLFDVWFSERSMVDSGAIDATLRDLRDRGVVYDADGATWLRSTDFGDDKDRVLVRSDGEATYLLPDIAYHRDKWSRGFDTLIDVWGADHHGYVPRMRAAMAALGHDADSMEFAITQLVTLERNGVEVKLSKRSGDLVTLDELIDEVGADAARFTYLSQSIDSRQTVDLALLAQRSMDNPVFYVQYAHARVCSLARVAESRGIQRRPLAEVDLGRLVSDRELELIRILERFDDELSLAVTTRAPHRVAAWVRELAAAFHGFYHDCPILAEGVDPDLAQARWWLAEAARVGIAVALNLLGVTAPESMNPVGGPEEGNQEGDPEEGNPVGDPEQGGPEEGGPGEGGPGEGGPGEGSAEPDDVRSAP